MCAGLDYLTENLNLDDGTGCRKLLNNRNKNKMNVNVYLNHTNNIKQYPEFTSNLNQNTSQRL